MKKSLRPSLRLSGLCCRHGVVVVIIIVIIRTSSVKASAVHSCALAVERAPRPSAPADVDLGPHWLSALPRAPSAAWAFGLHSLRRPSKHAQKGQSASASCTHSALGSATRRICRKAWARLSHAQASPATACTSDGCRRRPCISLAAGARLKEPGWKSQAEAARPHNKMKTSDTLSKNADPQPVPERKRQGATARRLIGTNWEHAENQLH